MQILQPDIDGIERSGAHARQRGESFHANPHYWTPPTDSDEWFAITSAWARGWLKEDAGRDKGLSHWMRIETGGRWPARCRE
jgi:hypothetical protein